MYKSIREQKFEFMRDYVLARASAVRSGIDTEGVRRDALEHWKALEKLA